MSRPELEHLNVYSLPSYRVTRRRRTQKRVARRSIVSRLTDRPSSAAHSAALSSLYAAHWLASWKMLQSQPRSYSSIHTFVLHNAFIRPTERGARVNKETDQQRLASARSSLTGAAVSAMLNAEARMRIEDGLSRPLVRLASRKVRRRVRSRQRRFRTAGSVIDILGADRS